jgi:hypothetical protein
MKVIQRFLPEFMIKVKCHHMLDPSRSPSLMVPVVMTWMYMSW